MVSHYETGGDTFSAGTFYPFSVTILLTCRREQEGRAGGGGVNLVCTVLLVRRLSCQTTQDKKSTSRALGSINLSHRHSALSVRIMKPLNPAPFCRCGSLWLTWEPIGMICYYYFLRLSGALTKVHGDFALPSAGAHPVFQRERRHPCDKGCKSVQLHY